MWCRKNFCTKQRGKSKKKAEYHQFNGIQPSMGVKELTYRLRFINSPRSSSTVVIILEFAWKPR